MYKGAKVPIKCYIMREREQIKEKSHPPARMALQLLAFIRLYYKTL